MFSLGENYLGASPSDLNKYKYIRDINDTK